MNDDNYCPYSGGGLYISGFDFKNFRNYPTTGEPIVTCSDKDCPFHNKNSTWREMAEKVKELREMAVETEKLVFTTVQNKQEAK